MVVFQIIVNGALNGAFEQWRCLLAVSISLTGFLARTDVLKPLDSVSGITCYNWNDTEKISMSQHKSIFEKNHLHIIDD